MTYHVLSMRNFLGHPLKIRNNPSGEVELAFKIQNLVQLIKIRITRINFSQILLQLIVKPITSSQKN